MASAYCRRCEVRTGSRLGMCIACGTENDEQVRPDPEAEEAGQVPLFPIDQIAS